MQSLARAALSAPVTAAFLFWARHSQAELAAYGLLAMPSPVASAVTRSPAAGTVTRMRATNRLPRCRHRLRHHPPLPPHPVAHSTIG